MSENQTIPSNQKEKNIFANFIDAVEKHDPGGLAKAYYSTLIGKYEKKIANEGYLEADKKALEYLKNNDPTGFVKWYYEESKLGKFEKDLIKSIDHKMDDLDKSLDKGIKTLVNEAKELIHGSILPNNNINHHNKQLPGKAKNIIQID